MKINYITTLCIATGISLLLLKNSFSQDTKLDESFGKGGIVTTALNVRGDSRLQATALQSDGKIIAVGSYRNLNGNNDVAIVRFCKEGGLDPTFGSNGIVIPEILSGNEEAFAVAIQPDGKIVVGGAAEVVNTMHFLIARYNSDGSVDSSFGIYNSGFNVAFFQPKSSEIRSLIIQNDGKIIAAGNGIEGVKFSLALARFNSNGIIDSSFGTAGTFTDNPDPNDYENGVHTAIIQQDGKIVVGRNHSMARYKEDGSVDSTFGISGTTKLPSNVFSAAMTIGADKKIYTGGNNGTDFTLMRYNSSGIPDSTFGTDAMKVTVIGETGGFINSIHVQNDGKIIASGNVGRTELYIGMVRYKSNGDPDNTFGSNGVYTEKIGNWTSSSLLRSDGKLLVAGNISLYESTSCFYVASFNSNGSLDKSFASNGISRGEIGITSSTIISMAVQNDGKIVTAGTNYNPITSKNDVILYRYNSDGMADNTFGTNGIVSNPVNGMSIHNPGCLVLQKDGKIVVGGSGDNKFELVRFNSNGTLDSDFGENGIVFTAIQTSSSIASVLVQKDGKLIAVGNSLLTGHKSNFTLVRYNENGSPDISFGENGIQIVRFDDLESQVGPALLQADGKIIAGGHFRNEANKLHFAMVRCNPDGTQDSTFGSDGKVITLVRQSGYITSLGLQKEGKIVAAGSSNSGYALARYNPDGSLDSLSFGMNGFVFDVPEKYSYGEIRSMIIRPDGKIMVTGRVNDGSTGVFSIINYTENGKLDTTFGTKGIVATYFGLATYAFPYTIMQQNDGNVLLGGNMGTDNYYVNCLARYKVSTISNDIQDLTDETQILEQNFPNPFYQHTKIKYVVPEEAYVTIKIYDLRGREIKSLVNETQRAGQYEIEFSSEGLSTGIYLYRLSVGTLAEIKKLIVVK